MVFIRHAQGPACHPNSINYYYINYYYYYYDTTTTLETRRKPQTGTQKKTNDLCQA